MKQIGVVLLVVLLAVMGGCFNSHSDGSKGSIALNLDFNQLISEGGIKKATTNPTITSVKIVLSREGYSSINNDLTVTNNVANGKINNLAEGFWHVKADVFSNSSKIYSGESDVKVIADIEVECQILFDSVITKTTMGSINITVGMNPMPGYKLIQQNINKIMTDEINKKLYILDNSTKSIGVYSSDTFNKLDEYILEQAPLSICMKNDKSGFILGYSTGQVYKFDISNKKMTLIGDFLYKVNQVIAINDKFILASGPSNWNDDLKTMDITSGKIIDTKNDYESFGEFTYNPVTNTVYTNNTGVSPQDIYYIKIDLLTGKITSFSDSRYHGDYSFGDSIRVINNGSRIICPSGNIFASSELPESDIVYSGSIGMSYADLISDDAKGYLYLLNCGSDSWSSSQDVIRKLIILNQKNYFVSKTVELSGDPIRVLNTADNIVIISENQNKYYAKVLTKASLQL